MATLNRDLDVSQQKETWTANIAPLINGVTYSILTVPYPMAVKACAVSCQGISGAPVGFLEVLRFISGSGLTAVTGLGATIPIPSYGTSGFISVSLAASGTTLAANGATVLLLQQGDHVVLRSAGGTAAAATQVSVSLVCQALQDTKAHFSVTV